MSVGLFEGSINSDVFYAWLTQVLVPVLPVNAVVVMDNANFHKRADMVEAIKQSGALLEFLAPYSAPEFDSLKANLLVHNDLNLKNATTRAIIALFQSVY